MKNKEKFFIKMLTAFFVIILTWGIGRVVVSYGAPRDRLIIRKEKLSIVEPNTYYYIESEDSLYRYRVFGEDEIKFARQEFALVKFTTESFIHVDIREYRCSPNWTNKLLLCVPRYQYIFYVPENSIHYLGD
jgi:hypothetical protein